MCVKTENNDKIMIKQEEKKNKRKIQSLIKQKKYPTTYLNHSAGLLNRHTNDKHNLKRKGLLHQS